MKRKVIFLILAASIAFIPVFSVLSIINSFAPNLNHFQSHDCEHDHHKTKDDHNTRCPICLKIELTKNSTSSIKMGDAIINSYNILVYLSGIVLKYSELGTYNYSPIVLKVRLNT